MNLVIIGSSNGFLPVWHQAIITWTKVDLLSVRFFRTALCFFMIEKVNLYFQISLRVQPSMQFESTS